MEINAITGTLAISPQITTEDLADIEDAGFRSIICNRPDGECSDQPTFEEIETAAEEHGLEARYLPVVLGKVQDEGPQLLQP